MIFLIPGLSMLTHKRYDVSANPKTLNRLDNDLNKFKIERICQLRRLCERSLQQTSIARLMKHGKAL